MDTPVLILADAVFPVARPPIAQGAVAFQGPAILDVGPAPALRKKFPDAGVVELPNHILLPGLVNAHCHLELSYLHGRFAPPRHFTQWVADLMASYPTAAELPSVITTAAKDGMDASLRAGVTTVGDISRQAALTRAVLRAGPLRVISFGEVVGLGTLRDQLPRWLSAAADRSQESPTLRTGISPHAPYTVESSALRASVARAVADRLPLTMHLAELLEETEFLATLGGPLGRAWDVMLRLNIIDDAIPVFPQGPIRWAHHCGLLTAPVPVLLAHVNYATDGDLDFLAQTRASVAYCPRTHHFFGHDTLTPHRFRDMLARKINVCLATDSLASNPDLSLLREAQFILQHDPAFSPTTLLEIITVNGARALGGLAGTGTIVAGGAADLAAFPIPQPRAGEPIDMLRAVLASAPAASAVWVSGRKAL